MPYTPVELRHVRLARVLLGYERNAVDRLLLDVADSFEVVWRERGELEDRVELLERELELLRKRGDALSNALVAAEQAAAELREHAKREAELIVAEAHQEARSITRGVQSEHARLTAEVRRMEALLRAALGMVEESAQSAAPAEGAPVEPEPESWPRREDTREFPRPIRPVRGLDPSAEVQAG
jgi:cell division initiation protein